MDNELNKLKLIYTDILRGFTRITTKEFGEVFIKHFTIFDSASIDEFYSLHYDKAIKDGLPSFKSQQEQIIKDGFWSDEKESRLESYEPYIANLKVTRSKVFIKAQKVKIEKDIASATEELNKLRSEKMSLISLTAESFAMKKVNEFYVKEATFKKKDFSTPLLTEENFDELDEVELANLVNAYNSATNHLSPINIKKVAVSSFFLNYFYLCDDNPYTFFGKPLCELTFYQVELFSQGRYFKSVLGDSKTQPPPEYYKDPEKLIDWYESNKSAEGLINKSKDKESTATSFVGATKEDLKNLGYDDKSEIVNLEQLSKQKGGLNMQDLIKLHGL
jgi:hypothetical protein